MHSQTYSAFESGKRSSGFSDKWSRHQNTYEDPIFRYFFLVICFLSWFDLISALALECPRFDLLLGQTGYRLLHVIALVQQTLDLVGAFAFPSQKYRSIFRIWVDKALFVRLLRIPIIVQLSHEGWKQRLGEMHIMIRALTGTGWVLLLCFLMSGIILLPWGIYFTDKASVYIAQLALGNAIEVSDEMLIGNWGSLPCSVYSLFNAMLGGSDWGEKYDSLSVLDWKPRAIFIAFICFTYVALLSTVRLNAIILGVEHIFREIDENGNGLIVLRELNEIMQPPDVAAYFSKLGLDTYEVDRLFVLVGAGSFGYVSEEEFMWGWFRLKCGAKSLDLEIMHRELKFVIKLLKKLQRAE